MNIEETLDQIRNPTLRAVYETALLSLQTRKPEIFQSHKNLIQFLELETQSNLNFESLEKAVLNQALHVDEYLALIFLFKKTSPYAQKFRSDKLLEEDFSPSFSALWAEHLIWLRQYLRAYQNQHSPLPHPESLLFTLGVKNFLQHLTTLQESTRNFWQNQDHLYAQESRNLYLEIQKEIPHQESEVRLALVSLQQVTFLLEENDFVEARKLDLQTLPY